MKQENTRMVKNTGVMYARLIISTLIGILTSRFILQSLGASDYGLYAVVGGLVSMLHIMSAAMHTTTRRFINVEVGAKDGNLNRVFNVSRLLHIGFSLLFLFLAETIGMYYIYNFLNVPSEKFYDAIVVYQISIISVVIGIINIPYQALLEAFEEFVWIAVVDIISAFLKLFFVICLLYYSGNVLVFFAIGVSSLTVFSLFFYNIICMCKWKEVIRYHFYKGWNQYKDILFFNNYVALGASTYMARSQGTPLMVNYFFGTIVNAAFAIGYMIENYCMTFVNNISVAASPQITQNYDGNYNRSIIIAETISKISFYLMLVIVVPLASELDFILHLWLGQVPDGTLVVCYLMLLSALTRMSLAGIGTLIHASGKIKWFQIMGSLCEIAAFPFSFFMFKMGLPAWTILIAMILCSIANTCSSFYLMHKILYVDVKQFLSHVYYPLAKLLFVFIVFLYVYWKLQIESTIGHFTGLFLSFIFALVVIFLIGFSKEENVALLSKIFNKLK